MENCDAILDYVIKNNIEVVSFDLWNTLLFDDDEINKGKLLNSYFKGLGQINWSNELDKYHWEFKRLEQTGKVISMEYRVNFILSKRNQTLTKLISEVGKKAEQRNYRINRELEELIFKLKKLKIKLAIISNTGSISAVSTRTILKRYKLDVFDYIYLSSEHGVGKPSPIAFQKTARELCNSLSSFVHVGDSYISDYVGGMNSGVKKIFLI